MVVVWYLVLYITKYKEPNIKPQPLYLYILYVTKCDNYFITKYDKYLLQHASAALFENAAVNKCDIYYKMRQHNVVSAVVSHFFRNVVIQWGHFFRRLWLYWKRALSKGFFFSVLKIFSLQIYYRAPPGLLLSV